MAFYSCNGIEMSSADMSDILSPLPSARGNWIEYSTTEQRVGTWIDGKPLYQKVCTKDFSSYSQTVNVDTGLTNITMIAMDVRLSYSNGSLYPCVYGNSSNYLACYFAASNGTVVITDKISNVTSGTFFVTLQYTKTTD